MSTTTTPVALESERHALAGVEEVAGKSPDEVQDYVMIYRLTKQAKALGSQNRIYFYELMCHPH